MKKTALALAALLAATLAHAAPRNYAVLSLAGDSITTMVFVSATGTRINPNDKDVLPFAGTVLDETAIRSASSALEQAMPGTEPFLMLTLDGELHKAQNAMFDEPANQQANRDYLKTLWKGHGVSHLILVSKFRAEPEVKYQNTTDGSGKVEGLGFYMDNRVNVVVDDDNKGRYHSKGVLVPFAYLKLRLVDADTLAVLGEATEKVSGIVTYPPEAESGVHAWDALTPTQKIEHLDHLIDKAVRQGVAKLLALPAEGAKVQ
jgi:hypothetical protein